ncbi:MAG TPA: hypothetical protein EYG67_05365 [Campylobacterales bacterium]|nr:hypothetical protein [Campylobacterales bacterium]HIP41592.1 hypothetical protein [Campylobacterales bacterium]
MRKLTLILLTAILIPLLNGCNPQQMMSHTFDPKLPKLNSVKAIPSSTSVGFEWQPVQGIAGVNIYRTDANAYAQSRTKQLTKVATISNPFASHYVDTGLMQDSAYTYTFTTIRGEYESGHGKVVEIKTLPPMSAVSFFQGIQKSKNSIKLIWRPHQDIRIKMYKIEKSINGQDWKWIDNVHHRMMVEYIDNYVQTGNTYRYRVIAVGFDDSFSKTSKVVTLQAR